MNRKPSTKKHVVMIRMDSADFKKLQSVTEFFQRKMPGGATFSPSSTLRYALDVLAKAITTETFLRDFADSWSIKEEA